MKKRANRFDMLAAQVARDMAHQHTVTINSRQRVLQFELGEVERAIVALTAARSNQQARKAVIEAQLKGLAAVVEKR